MNFLCSAVFKILYIWTLCIHEFERRLKICSRADDQCSFDGQYYQMPAIDMFQKEISSFLLYNPLIV